MELGLALTTGRRGEAVRRVWVPQNPVSKQTTKPNQTNKKQKGRKKRRKEGRKKGIREGRKEERKKCIQELEE